MPVPNVRFEELLGDIEPSATTKTRASSAHSGVREHLRTHARFRFRYLRSFLTGSYARDTSIRPRISIDGEERPDVDIIIVTSFESTDRPDAVLRELARALEDGGYEVTRINKRSVRVETSHVHMDVVPLIDTWNGFLIADRETGRWIYTNPPKHTEWSSEQNQLFDGRFKPMVKLLKWWRRINPSGKRPKGLALEKLVSLYSPVAVLHWGEAFAQLLQRIYAEHGFRASLGIKPTLEDPADSANDILRKVTVAQWKDFMDKVRVYADIARRAQQTDDVEESTRLWRRVFGDRFKSTAGVAKESSYGGFDAVLAPAGYRFPSFAVIPPSKPRGFA